MGLQAKYDARADRMLLTVQAAEGTPVAIWVTRRQWLNLLHALPGFMPASAEGAAAAGTNSAATEPPARRERRQFAPAGEPVELQSLRVVPLDAGVKVIFVIGEQAVGVEFTEAGVQQLLAMLQQQAERAGWDASAALARLDAALLANAAMKNARKLH